MGKSEREKPMQGAEQDERFPSGPWTGFWVQRPEYPNRQWMRDLQLTFKDGRVAGLGSDSVGDFSFVGTYDLKTGAVVLHKQYERAHGVRYEGRNENDGMWVWGVWQLVGSTDRGGFHMWPKGVDDPTQQRLKAEKELPVEGRTLVGIGPVTDDPTRDDDTL
jgi:hypothetical protein